MNYGNIVKIMSSGILFTFVMNNILFDNECRKMQAAYLIIKKKRMGNISPRFNVQLYFVDVQNKAEIKFNIVNNEQPPHDLIFHSVLM